MKDDVIRIIKSHPHNDALDLINKQIGDDDIELVINTIVEKLPKLRELHLDNNSLSDHGAKKLARYLPSLRSLTLLSVQFNQIDKDGANSIFSVRNELTELNILFRGNKIKNAGLMHEIELNSGPSFRY